MEISNLISAFGMLGFIALFATLASLVQVMGTNQRGQEQNDTGVASLLHRMISIRNSDWLRAFFLLTPGAPLLPPPLLGQSADSARAVGAEVGGGVAETAAGQHSAAHSASRSKGRVEIAGTGELVFRDGFGYETSLQGDEVKSVYWHRLTGRVMTLDERDLVFTARSHDLLNQLSRWNAISVFSKAVWLGLGYFLLQVGDSKVTTLFLAWLNLQVDWMSVTAISFAVFFLPLGLFSIPLMA
mmetsp:Transcript_9885/g.20105  ORF Transcript_9885/g.20105 Transcript_9885/m.20105 type:complete len:242 (-) Transcript_9885:1494-2219(-)